MSRPEEALVAIPGGASERPEEDGLPAYCANPACGQEFRRKTGPGRRHVFHSELCRRDAERNHRRAVQRLEHLRAQVRQQELLVAALARSTSPPDEASARSDLELDASAREAVARVGGMMLFLQDSDEVLAVELKSLYGAVAPLVGR